MAKETVVSEKGIPMIVEKPDVVTESGDVEIELHVELITNGTLYGKGATDQNLVKVVVPKDVAEDLLRRQEEFDRVERERYISRTITFDAGTISAAGK